MPGISRYPPTSFSNRPGGDVATGVKVSLSPISDDAFQSKCALIKGMIDRDELTCINAGRVLSLFALGAKKSLSRLLHHAKCRGTILRVELGRFQAFNAEV
jgi:hypothetical protein